VPYVMLCYMMLCYVLFYHIMLPLYTAPPLPLHPPLLNVQVLLRGDTAALESVLRNTGPRAVPDKDLKQ